MGDRRLPASACARVGRIASEQTPCSSHTFMTYNTGKSWKWRSERWCLERCMRHTTSNYFVLIDLFTRAEIGQVKYSWRYKVHIDIHFKVALALDVVHCEKPTYSWCVDCVLDSYYSLWNWTTDELHHSPNKIPSRQPQQSANENQIVLYDKHAYVGFEFKASNRKITTGRCEEGKEKKKGKKTPRPAEPDDRFKFNINLRVHSRNQNVA